MKKLAFFDVDGTLLKLGEKYPTRKTIYALNRLQTNGYLLCMATGRSLPCVPKFDGIKFDILMCFNGSYIVNDREVIYKNPFNRSDANIIINNLKNMNRAIAISNEKMIFSNGSDYDLEQYFKFGSETNNVREDFDELCKDDIYQIMCSCNESEHSRILAGTNNVKITAWWDRAVDIIPANSGKGKAVNEILNYYNINKEDAIAFGDGNNDVEMLKAVGCGIAMGNAKDDVKNQADVVCKSAEDDGIYHYCLDNGLI